jgi:hypothetical protein
MTGGGMGSALRQYSEAGASGLPSARRSTVHMGILTDIGQSV